MQDRPINFKINFALISIGGFTFGGIYFTILTLNSIFSGGNQGNTHKPVVIQQGGGTSITGGYSEQDTDPNGLQRSGRVGREEEGIRKDIQSQPKMQISTHQPNLKDDFNKYCYCEPGTPPYEGTFQYGTRTFRVQVNFVNRHSNNAVGTITIWYPARNSRDRESAVSRGFYVAVDPRERADPPVTGEIDNEMMPSWEVFRFVASPLPGDEQWYRNFYDMLSSHTKIHIRIEGNGMQFSLHHTNETSGTGIPLDLRQKQMTARPSR